MGLEVFSAHLVAMLLAPAVWGHAEIFCLGWQRLGMLEGAVMYVQGRLQDSGGGWCALFCFPSRCQCPETGLTFVLGTPRRNNHGSAPSDPVEGLCPIAQLMWFLGALDSTRLDATGEA